MDRYTIKLIYYDIQSTSEKAAIKNCLIAHDDSGEWVRYEDAAARIEELELRIADESRACALFQSHIRELEAQLSAAQERNTKLQSEHLDHVYALHEQLTAANAEIERGLWDAINNPPEQEDTDESV